MSPADPMAPIAVLLERRLGLSIDAVGGYTGLATRCGARADALGLSRGDYVSRLVGDESEISALVESLVVPETWFHRDGAPFRAVAERAVAATRGRPAALFRVLSVPCSTGEEAYSIAMAVLDAGVPETSLTVHARDVSRVAIERAREGRYGAWSFRSDALRGREHWFIAGDGEWTVGDTLRRCIDWGLANVMDPAFLALAGEYDAIFCRNLLIYLTPAARRQVLDKLIAHLTTDGVIVGGHAENLATIDRRLALLPGSAFVWRRAPPEPVPPPRARRPASGPQAPRRRATTAAGSPPPPPPPPSRPVPAVAPSRPVPAVEPALHRARVLADAGRLDEARALCAEQLRDTPTDAEACFLSGTLASAGGDPTDAERWFVRTVYLAPRHYEALVQLASLCAKRGDAAAARNYRRRAAAARGEAP